MKPRKVIKECEKALRKDPENLVVRLKLAAAYREVGRTEQAVELYRSVAVAYHAHGRLAQAIAVCKSVLEIDPSQQETQALLAELDRMRGVGEHAHHAPRGRPEHAHAADPGWRQQENDLPSIAPAQLPARLELGPRGPLAPSGAAEWGRSGMTPHSDDDPMHGVARLTPGTRQTERMLAPPQRRSSGAIRITPTPLPRPLAFHEEDDSAMTPLPDDDAPTRIAPDLPADEDAPTRIADPTQDRVLSAAEVGAEVIDSDEDALATVAEAGAFAPGGSPQDRRVTAPMRSQAAPDGFPSELAAYQRGDRLLDVDTDVRGPGDYGLRDPDEEPTNPGRASSTRVDPDPEPAGMRGPGPELELAHAFDRPFAETIRRLDPDGGAIDAPLTIFSDLPDAALEEMARGMVLRRFESGEIVLREGDPGDACFVIATGAVRVLKRDPVNPRGDFIEVARLGDGALFGEFALLADRRRHATVQAVATSEIYEIPRKLLRELAATFPAVGPLLEAFYRERLLATLLATAPFFKPLAEARRAELLARFVPRRAESGEAIITEGKPAGGLYLIVLGSVEITKRVADRRSVLLATLGEGAYFGEMSLLRGNVASATVVAAGPAELAVMPPREFYDVVAHNPTLWDEIRRTANERELDTNQLVTGDTNVV